MYSVITDILTRVEGEGEPMDIKRVGESSIVSFLAIVITITNIVIIGAYLSGRGQQEVINIYILSIAVADLMVGLLVIPLSFHPMEIEEWEWGDIACMFIGYMFVTLWIVTVFSFMWMSVDRYLAVRKPLRYETVQTRTRCQCWMAFTWISSLMLCSPPLLGYYKPMFNLDARICMLDWGNMAAYSITLAILVTVPSLVTIVYTYWYIFLMMRRVRKGVPIHDKEYATALAENLGHPSHIMCFILIVMFYLSWAPYAGVRFYEFYEKTRIESPSVQFGIIWFGIANSFWKGFVLLAWSPQYRSFLKLFCKNICCKIKSRPEEDAVDIEEE